MPATKGAGGGEFLRGMYDPPLERFPDPEEDPHGWARAEAWGEAVQGWLEQYKNRGNYRMALAGLWSACRKLPWEVRLVDAERWLEEGMQGYTAASRRVYASCVVVFYRYACEQKWTTPGGRNVRLCRTNLLEGLKQPKIQVGLRAVPLTEEEVERLMAAFDRQTAEGRRARAVFEVVLETGMRLRETLRLTFGEVQERVGMETAARKAVWRYLEGEGRLGKMEAGEFVFRRFLPEHIQSFDPITGEPAGYKQSRQSRCRPIAKDPRIKAWYEQPIGISKMGNEFRAAMKRAGLDAGWVSVETLRYTGARRLMEAGAGVEEIATYLGLSQKRVREVILPALKAAVERETTERRSTLKKAKPVQDKPRWVKHGQTSRRFSLKKLGIQGHKISGVPSEMLQETIVRLRLMTRELFEQPSTGSAELEAQRLLKLSAMAETIGKLKKRMVEEEWGKGPDGVKGKGMRLCVICPEAEGCIDSPVCPLLGEEAGTQGLAPQGLAPQGLAPQEMEPQDFAALREWFDRRPRLGEKHKRGKREGQGLKLEELEARLREAFGERERG